VLKVKVYIVFWADAFDDWRLVKAFSTREKAEQFIKGKSSAFWIEEQEVE
jgi:hypothetical protein